jgi:hypothetical protein
MKQGFMDAVGSGLEHLQSGIDNLRQNADRLKAIGQITLLGVGAGTGIGIALPSAVSAEGPVNSSDRSAEATASSLQQDCIDASFNSAHFKSGQVSAPMRFGLRTYSYKADLDPMPPDCLGNFSRSVQFIVQVQDAHKRQVWHNATDRGSTNDQGAVPINIVKSPLRTNSSETPVQCTPGKAKTGVRLVSTARVFKENKSSDSSSRGRKLVATKVVIKKPFKVRKAC